MSVKINTQRLGTSASGPCSPFGCAPAAQPALPQPAVESCRLDVTLLARRALSHLLLLAHFCALCSLAGEEVVPAVSSACTWCTQGTAKAKAGRLGKGTWERLGVLFPGLIAFGSVSLDQNHFPVELLT